MHIWTQNHVYNCTCVWVLQEADAKTELEVQETVLGKCLWKITWIESRSRQGRSSDHDAGLTSVKGEGEEGGVCRKGSDSRMGHLSQVGEEPRDSSALGVAELQHPRSAQWMEWLGKSGLPWTAGPEGTCSRWSLLLNSMRQVLSWRELWGVCVCTHTYIQLYSDIIHNNII